MPVALSLVMFDAMATPLPFGSGNFCPPANALPGSFS